MNFKSNIPIYLQIIDEIKKNIITGALPLGSKLPSSRELALQYQINPNTAARVYNEMESIGLSYTRWGIFLLIAALFAGSMLIDTDARTRAGYQHRVQEKAKQEIAEIEKVEKKVQDTKEISEQEAAEILKELEDTKKALEDAENYQEIQKAADRGWLKLSDAAHSENQTLNQTLSEAVEQKQEQKNKNLERREAEKAKKEQKNAESETVEQKA